MPSQSACSVAATPIPLLTSSSRTTTFSPSDPKTLAVNKELAERVLARRRLIPFTKRINPRYHAGWVHEDIARRLERFSEEVDKGLSPRLMLLMPPRAGKSELASRMFPAWHLGRYPDHEVIACSYNVALAMSFSRKVKETIDDPSYQSVFTTRLNPNFQGAEEWGIESKRGGYVAAGVGGGINGKGAHVLVIDDPLKNAEEADSADLREKIWDWYGSTAYTRLAPGGGVLIVQTWWHDDDLAGRLQEAMRADPEADQFEVVKYPAIAEHDEFLDTSTDEIVRLELNLPEAEEGEDVLDAAVIGAQAQMLGLDTSKLRFLRRKGEALHPQRYDLVKLNRIKKTIPPRFWSALYQQNPVPDDGEYFRKDQFRRAPVPPVKRANVFIAWDFAISQKKQNDYTVGTVALQDDDDMLHIADVFRFKSGDAFYIVEAILDLCQKWYSPTLMLGFEDGQIYKAIEAVLKKRMRERRLYPSVTVLKPITDKLARARTIQGRMQQGKVSFNDQGGWFDIVRTEMLRFPAGVHDDCVDSAAWVAQLAVDRAPPPKPKIQQVKSWKDRLKTGAVGTVGHMAA
jgi:predicted phage terminase large subunit-like protein